LPLQEKQIAQEQAEINFQNTWQPARSLDPFMNTTNQLSTIAKQTGNEASLESQSVPSGSVSAIVNKTQSSWT